MTGTVSYIKSISVAISIHAITLSRLKIDSAINPFISCDINFLCVKTGFTAYVEELAS